VLWETGDSLASSEGDGDSLASPLLDDDCLASSEGEGGNLASSTAEADGDLSCSPDLAMGLEEEGGDAHDMGLEEEGDDAHAVRACSSGTDDLVMGLEEEGDDSREVRACSNGTERTEWGDSPREECDLSPGPEVGGADFAMGLEGEVVLAQEAGGKLQDEVQWGGVRVTAEVEEEKAEEEGVKMQEEVNPRPYTLNPQPSTPHFQA